MLEFDEAGVGQVRAPALKIVIGAVTLAVPAFDVVAARVGAKENAVGFEGRMQLAQYARQFRARYVEQRSVGKNAAELFVRQVEPQKVLLPDLAAGLVAGHLRETLGAVDADRAMAETGENLEVAPRPAAQIENGERRRAYDMAQQRVDVLPNIVILRSVAKFLGALIVVRERLRGNLLKVERRQGQVVSLVVSGTIVPAGRGTEAPASGPGRVATESEPMNRITISSCAAAEAIPHDAWAAVCPPGDPFLNADFLAILERHGAAGRACGWAARHLLASASSGAVLGVLPLYLRANSHGDFIHDWSWASAYQQLGRAYYPKLLSGLPHTPATGPRLLVAAGVDADQAVAVRRALIDGALALAGEYGVSSWHVAFPGDEDRAELQKAGLLASHHVQFQWLDGDYGDFDGYLTSFAADKRRKVRAQRRRVAESGLTIEVRHGDEIEVAEWPALHALYASTFEKFNNLAVLSAACLAALAQALARRMVLFIARDGGVPVALSLCFRSDEVLYGRYWGCSGNYHSLHFELCFYQGIAYCLSHGLRRFEPGAGGEHKIARGFTPTLVHGAHFIADPVMRRLIGDHLERQSGAVAAYRDEATEHLPFSGAT